MEYILFSPTDTANCMEGGGIFSNIDQQSPIMIASQIPTPLPSPGWGGCDLDLSTYSPLFDNSFSSDSIDTSEVVLDESKQWDFETSCGGAHQGQLLQDITFTDCFASPGGSGSPKGSNSDTCHSGLSSPKMFESLDNRESHDYEQTWDLDAQAIDQENQKVDRPLPIKPRWASCRGNIKPIEPFSVAPMKRPRVSKEDSYIPSQNSSEPSSSKKSRRAKGKPADSQAVIPSKGRKDHNLIEKKYRSKLNGQFETLLASLPPELVAEVNEARVAARQPEKAISKAEVLSLAKEHIEKLEKQRAALEKQRGTLRVGIRDLKDMWMTLGGEMMP